MVLQLVVGGVAEVLDLAALERVHLHALATVLLHRHCLRLTPPLRPHDQQTALVHVSRVRLEGERHRVHQRSLAEEEEVTTRSEGAACELGGDDDDVVSRSAQKHGLLLQLHGGQLLQRHDVSEANGVVPTRDDARQSQPADRHAHAVRLERAVAVALVALHVTTTGRSQR